jgi:glycosyltransferase involved in cell wall biosynthesis
MVPSEALRFLKTLLRRSRSRPKILAVFSNCQLDCDRLILHLLRSTANSPAAAYPIHVYCLETPLEAHRCAYLAIDCDSRRLFQRARKELADVRVELSVTSWNHRPRGTLIKILPLTIPPFRGIIVNENGDLFYLNITSVTRHFINRSRQWITELAERIAQWLELKLVWPSRHLRVRALDMWTRKLAWGTAIALDQLTQFASQVQPFTYSAFRNLPPGVPAPVDLDLTSVDDAGITRIEHEDNDWDRDTVARLAEDSQSRFLLFCHPGYIENLDDFLPLFADSRTFAVARQTGFREWRSIMLPLSPFRPLAPKEAARVAAPLGAALLVERKKLLQLPLPRTPVSGTAWLELFWRAGAAGWPSYCVGGNIPPPQQWDYFLEEILFLKHLYRDRDLRRLAIDAPALCRGNIAFRPDLCRPYRPLPRVLVVTPYLPFPPSHGGAVRVYNLCKALADRVDLIFVCLREVSDVVDYEVLHSIFRRVYIVDRDEVHRNPDLPELVNQSESSSMRALVAAVACEQKPDLLQIEWTDMAGYRETAPQLPAILVEHDVTHTLYRQLAEQDDRPKTRREHKRWLNFEPERLRAFDGVFVMSRQDKEEAVRSGSNAQRTFVIPNGVDLDRYRALPPPAGNTREILFVGTFAHQPNLIGFDELRVRIMPGVWRRFPDAILRVVAGPDHERHWRNSLKGSAAPDAAIPQLDARIILHGFVEDLVPLYQTAQVVVAPLLLAAGTSIKVMEALACQRAVISTLVGVRGLDLENWRDAVICEPGDEFVDAICKLLENPVLCGEIARRGRMTAEARFSWNLSANAALEAYSLLMRESRAQPAGDDGASPIPQCG